jgi:phosphoglycolate phosphatase
MGLLRNKQLLIFDCDGVLFDSHDANIAYFNSCLEASGHPPLEKELQDKVVYMSVRQLIDEIIYDPHEADRIFDACQDVDYSKFIPKLMPLFDFDHVLARLKQSYTLSMATNRGRSLDALFSHFRLERFFSYRISTLEAKPKPDPEMLVKCMERFGAEKSETVYIGDTPNDRAAAINAGIDCILIGGTGESDIKSVSELLLFIEN